MEKFIKSSGKYFVNLVIYILIGAGLIFLVFGDYLRLSGFAVSILLILLPHYWYSRSPKFQRKVDKIFIDLAQVIIAFACFANFFGSVDFYSNPKFWWYDSALHFINPSFIFLITALFVVLFQLHFFQKSYLSITLIVNFVLIIFCSFLWEFYEYIIDAIFTGASMFGQNGEIYTDTLTDLSADLAGGLAATWLIYKYFYGYILRNVKLGD
ncbi:hypothetical protein KJ840_03335 [Patescibacteria group bacterium]|nr:hypothetical protein [Patescibacteria group bacterium]